jgi:hypothetical protein
MKFIRSLLGQDDAGDTGSEADGSAGGSASVTESAEDEAARELRLAREFDAGLSDLARQQLRFAAYATEPPPQVNRQGTWYCAALVEARDGSGRAITLEVETPLEYVGDDAPKAMLRFRIADRREVMIEGDTAEGWPAALVRSGDLESARTSLG